jgi:hypothetical protein
MRLHATISKQLGNLSKLLGKEGAEFYGAYANWLEYKLVKLSSQAAQAPFCDSITDHGSTAVENGSQNVQTQAFKI